MARAKVTTDYAEDLDGVAAQFEGAKTVMRMMPSCHPHAGVQVGYQRAGQRLYFKCATCDESIGNPIAVARNPKGLN